MRRQPTSKGFTFVEVLIVVVIVGLLTGMGLLAFSKQREDLVRKNFHDNICALEQVRVKLTTTLNVPGRFGATGDEESYVWGADTTLSLQFNASGNLVSTSSEGLTAAIQRYMMRFDSLGLAVARAAKDNAFGYPQTPINIAGTVTPGLVTLAFNGSTWTLSN